MADKESDLPLLMKFGGPFPWHGTYQGEPVVVIPAEELWELWELRRLRKASGPSDPLPRRRSVAYNPPMRLSRLEQDPEVADFVRRRLGKVPQNLIRQEIEAKYGQTRTPSKAALSRFAVKWSLDRYRIAGSDEGAGQAGVTPSKRLKDGSIDPLRFDR